MRRRHKTAVILLLLVGSLLCAAVALWPREPTYQGRRLSRWLTDLASINPERVEKASNAVRQMGTNTIPGLLTAIRAKDSRFKVWLTDLVGAQHLAKLGFVPAQEHRRRATLAFQALGPAAKPALPALVPILNNGQTAACAALILSCMGPEGVCALTNACDNPDSRVRQAIIERVRCDGFYYETVDELKRTEAIPQRGNKMMTDLFVPVLLHYLRDTDPDVRAPAAEVLGALGAQPERVVPALVKLLQDSELYPRSAAVQALSGFGAQAKTAVPALVEYARRAGNKSERDEAIKALKEIDPEAVATAGLGMSMTEQE